MRLESARNIKDTLLATMRAPLIERFAAAVRTRGAGAAIGMGLGPVAAPRAKVRRLAAPRRAPVVAVGVSPHPTRKKEFRVAVRSAPGQTAVARALVQSFSGLGEKELDVAEGIRYVPRALRAGGSCGHVDITAGTLGGFVEDARAYYVLSNNHVLANSDLARKGDEIWQPGPLDVTGGKFDVIALLDRWATLSTTRTDGVDAAIASLSDTVEEFYPWRYTGIGDIDPRPIMDRYAVTRVTKKGRTTDVTVGTVSAFELDGVQINYGTRGSPRLVTFDDQIEFVHVQSNRDFSQAGDSGSWIFDRDTLRPYALLYGGGPDADGIDRTLGHFMPDVLAAMKVRVVT